MATIVIPFRPMFKEPMLNGVKRCTARSKAMGKIGDTFTAFGKIFLLQLVDEVPLYYVASLWKDEGCTSEAHFVEVWNSIHPIKGYQPDSKVYLHQFIMETI